MESAIFCCISKTFCPETLKFLWDGFFWNPVLKQMWAEGWQGKQKQMGAILLRYQPSISKFLHSELICSVASDYIENNKVKNFLGQNFRFGCLSDFKKLPRIWVASSKTAMEEFIFWKGCSPQSCNFTEDWVPLRKVFKSVSRIIGRYEAAE